MSEYKSLIATINANIRRNGNQEITGQVLNGVLNAMVGELGANYQFAGVADKNTDPGIPDAKVFYVPTEYGTYPNFGGLVVPKNKVYFFVWDGAWIALDTHMCEQMQEAEEARAIAEVARATAEAQRVLNENQRIANELIRQQGEETRNTRYEAAEAQRDAEYAEAEAERNEEFTQVEAVRNAGEQTRISNETARQTAEAGRQTAEALRVSKESARIAAETEREENEAERETAEAERETAEAARATAENNRISKENSRVAHENSRISAEAGRVEAEAEREEAEAAREEAEAARQTTFEANEERREEAYQEAIDNLGDEVVRTTPQSLTDAQKAQARENIGVGEDGVADMNTLASQLSAMPTEQSIVSRTSPSLADGLAKVKSIKGNSVVWNQKVSGIGSSAQFAVSGKTITATSSATSYASTHLLGSTEIVKGHKYLIAVNVVSNTFSTFAITTKGTAMGTNSLLVNDTTAGLKSAIVTAPSDSDDAFRFQLYDTSPNGHSLTYSYLVIYDLTQMFNGNEPTTYAEFLTRKPKVEDEFAYNGGEILNNTAKKIVVRGRQLFNKVEAIIGKTLLDGTGTEVTNSLGWCSPFIPIIGGTTYFAKGVVINTQAHAVHFYDESKQNIDEIGIRADGDTFTAPTNAKYIRIHGVNASGPASDAIVNVSDPSFNGQYESFKEQEFDVDTSTIVRPTLGIIKFKDLEWHISDGLFAAKLDSAISGENSNIHCESDLYRPVIGYGTGGINTKTDKTMSVGTSYLGSAFNVAVCDKAYTSLDDFVNHFTDADTFNFELADPSTYEGEHPSLFPLGTCSAGSAYDEDREREAVKRIGVKVFDGTENWGMYDSHPSIFYVITPLGHVLRAGAETAMANAYTAVQQLTFPYNPGDKTMYLDYANTNEVVVIDTAYTTKEAFKAHLADLYAQGKPLTIFYELATPIVVPHAERKMYFPSFKGGTESIVADGDSAPLRADIGYPLDLRSLFPSAQSEE